MSTDTATLDPGERKKSGDPYLCAGLIALLTITAVMLFSLFTLTEPHPPIRIPLFGLAPFLGTSLAIGLGALELARRGTRSAEVLALIFAATAALSFGPQKYFDPAFSLIWPAVLAAQVCIVVIAVRGGILAFTRRKPSSS